MMNSIESVSAFEQRLTDLEKMLEAHYYQLGKDVMALAEKEQAVINEIVNEIVDIRKKLSHMTVDS